MSFKERFNQFKNQSPIIEVSFPSTDPEFIFTVERIPQEELSQITLKTLNDYDNKSDNASNLYSASICLAIAKGIKKHCRSWVHTPKDGSEPLTFDPSFFDMLNLVEVIDLSLAYNKAVDSPTEKKS